MAREVEFTRAALKDLERLPDRESEAVLLAIETFAQTGRGDVKKLRGAGGVYRLRTGDWRAIFTETGRILRILRVKNRKEAYR